MARRRHDARSDPLGVLGLGEDATADDVIAARRRLSKRLHPDVGGNASEMGRINAAADEVLRRLGRFESRHDPRSSPQQRFGPSIHDHPSFTVEALPAVTFEALLIVARSLGEVIDDDPPYGLEVAMTDPIRGWCRLDVVPDAGASTVSVSAGAEPGYPVPGIEQVRDAWIDGLNELDWSGQEGCPRLPS